MFFDTPTQTAINSALIVFIFGGGVIAYLKYFREGQIENRSFAESEREKMRDEIDRLTKSVSAMSSRLIPSNLPTWIKDANKKYIDVNQAWEIQVGTRIGMFRLDVIGKTDLQVFHEFPEFAEKMVQLDVDAAAAGGLVVTVGMEFPRNLGKKTVVKEIVVHDILGHPLFKAMAIPEAESKK